MQSLTLNAALDLFLMVERAEATNKHYRKFLGKLFEGMGAERPLSDVTYIELLQVTSDHRARLSPSSAQQYLLVMKVFFNWAVNAKLIDVSPADQLKLKSPNLEVSTSRAIPPEDLEKLLAVTSEHPRDFAILMLLADSGIRRGSLVKLTIPQLSLEDGAAYNLWAKGDKRYNAYFTQATAEALRGWLKVRPTCNHDFVFVGYGEHRPLLPESISAMLRNRCREAGIQLWGPHALRHAVGHLYARNGVPISVTALKLGHSNPGVTMRFYYPRDENAVRQASQQFSLVGEDKS